MEKSRGAMSSRRLRVVMTPEARSDIGDILLYTELTWDREQRDEYWRHIEATIEATIERLAVMPLMGRIRTHLSRFDLRWVPVGTHLLYYWVDGNNLVIARVLHPRQDAEAVDWDVDLDE